MKQRFGMPVCLTVVFALGACDQAPMVAPPEPAFTELPGELASGPLGEPSNTVLLSQPQSTPLGLKALLYNSDDAASAAELELRLVATGAFTDTDIDILQMSSSPASLSVLQAYDCVYVWTNAAPPSAVAQGDRLKEYVDAGGKVILGVYAYSPTSRPWEMQGGIMGPGYSPLVNTDIQHPRGFATSGSLDFGTALLTHPVLAGVTDFTFWTNGNYGVVTVDPGATFIGKDESDVPLIAESASGQVVGFNLFFGGYSFWPKSAGVFQAMVNACPPAVISVAIDIKPGSDPNSINPKSNGVVPVAILGSDVFDVTDVDVTTLRFGPAGAAPAHDLTDPATYADHLQDVNGDGFLDLVSHYRQQETGLTPCDTEATITGATTSGTPIEGTDAVRVLGQC